jgi:O-antigen/teichoic acid export membrane protein
MISFLKSKAQGFWNIGHERTIKIKRNIIYSFLIKGTSVLIGFMLIPLTIHYINPFQYGIWLTISSLVAWMNTFDIGLSNGLRNKLAHSLALGEKENIVKYVSTTYAILFLIALFTFVLFFTIGSFFNWNHLLNINSSFNYNIWPIVIMALGALCIQFSLQPINSILIATHQPFKSSLILLFGQVLTFILTFLLTIFTKGNLLTLVIVVTASPVFIFLVANIYLFKTDLKSFAPKFNFIDFKSAKSLLNVGGVFFFIQIGALILFETDNIVITRTLGPREVTTFNIAYKYFAILTITFSIIMMPYWSAFTEAYAKRDIEWIKQSVNKMRKLWLYFSAAAILLYFFSDIFYKLWIGKAVTVPTSLSLSIAVYVMVQNWQIIHAYMLNGVGKLRLQLILVITTGIINIPLSVFLIGKVGLCGTVIANVLVIIFMGSFFTYQYSLIINQKAKGIWNK